MCWRRVLGPTFALTVLAEMVVVVLSAALVAMWKLAVPDLPASWVQIGITLLMVPVIAVMVLSIGEWIKRRS